jgi:hypothetical protein
MLTDDQVLVDPPTDRLAGLQVITKTIKEDPVGCRKLKGDMNVELAIQAMELAQYIDHLSYSRAMRQRRDRD